jgi:hypothetical protein
MRNADLPGGTNAGVIAANYALGIVVALAGRSALDDGNERAATLLTAANLARSAVLRTIAKDVGPLARAALGLTHRVVRLSRSLVLLAAKAA